MCACSRAARVRFVPSSDRPKAVSRVLISVTGNLVIRHRDVAGGSGGNSWSDAISCVLDGSLLCLGRHSAVV